MTQRVLTKHKLTDTINSKGETARTPEWRRICHPVTGRFALEYDAIHQRIRIVDRGHVATIDLELVQ